MTTLRTFLLTILVGFAHSLAPVARADIDIVFDNTAARFRRRRWRIGLWTACRLVFDRRGRDVDRRQAHACGGLPKDLGTTSVDLYTDSSTSPGTLIQNLGTIGDSSLSSSLALVNVSGFTAVNLAPTTRYWIEFEFIEQFGPMELGGRREWSGLWQRILLQLQWSLRQLHWPLPDAGQRPHRRPGTVKPGSVHSRDGQLDRFSSPSEPLDLNQA